MASKETAWWCLAEVITSIIAIVLMLDSTFNALTVSLLPEIVFNNAQLDSNSRNVPSWNLDSQGLTTLSENFPNLFYDYPNMSMKYENFLIGILVAGKAATQCFFYPILKYITYQYGSSLIILFGIVALFFASFLIATIENFYIILLSRIIHGIASSSVRVAGIGFLSSRNTDDENNKLFSLPLLGIASGSIIGPLFGGLLYDLIGRSSVYLILCFCLFLTSFLQLNTLRPDVNLKQDEYEQLNIKDLFTDLHLFTIASTLFIITVVFSAMETALPLRMIELINANSWQLGVVFFSINATYIVAHYFIFPSTTNMKRWFITDIGVLSIGLSQSILPTAEDLSSLIFPLVLAGFGKSIIDNALMPILIYKLSENNLVSAENTFIVGDIVTSTGYTIGPLISGIILSTSNFSSLMILLTCICTVAIPIIFISRNFLHARNGSEKERLIKTVSSYQSIG